MSKVQLTEEETALRRFNIYKNRHRQFLYVRKWRKKTYIISRNNFRLIQLYSYRFFAALLVFLFLAVWSSSWMTASGIALVLWGLMELFYEFFFIRHLQPTKMLEKDEQVGFVDGALMEDPKIVNIKMVSFFFVGVIAFVGALLGNYEGIYLYGMLGISVYGFFQSAFFLYVQKQRKKGK